MRTSPFLAPSPRGSRPFPSSKSLMVQSRGSRLRPAARGAALRSPRDARTQARGVAGSVALPDRAALQTRGAGEAGACLSPLPCSPICGAASWLELLSLELFVCLFITQVLLKITGLGQNHLWHRRAWGGDFGPDFSVVKQLLAAAEQTLSQRKSLGAAAFPRG